MPAVLKKALSEKGSGVFEPEQVAVLTAAYEKATKALHDRGQSEAVREVIANRIITLAEQGELDPQKLANIALESFGLRTD